APRRCSPIRVTNAPRITSPADSASQRGPVGEIRKSFHQQLDDIKQGVIELAAMVVESIPRATQALLDADLTAAQAVIDSCDVLDGKALEIDDECLRLLALQQPMASDLRVIMTAMRLNWDLERAGDLA